VALLDHEGGAEYPYHKDDVFQALVEAIPSIPGLSVASTDALGGRVRAKAGVSLFSWGEDIPISLSEIVPGRTRVSVTSTPKTGMLFGGAFDLGKNRRNIEKILEAVSENLSRRMPAASQPASASPADRLAKLKALLDDGLIEAQEYGRRKAEILSEI
jgi:hypothetical protein